MRVARLRTLAADAVSPASRSSRVTGQGIEALKFAHGRAWLSRPPFVILVGKEGPDHGICRPMLARSPLLARTAWKPVLIGMRPRLCRRTRHHRGRRFPVPKDSRQLEKAEGHAPTSAP